MLDPTTITPCIMVKNEDYWIHYVLRDLQRVFPNIIVLDTGSTDATKDMIRKSIINEKVLLVEENYGDDPHKIGNGRNVLRELCETHWMFLIDGDEIWQEFRLRKLLEFEIPDGKEVVMVAGWNVEDVSGVLKLRTNDLAARDGLFSPDIKWNVNTEYPFESYGLTASFPPEKVCYTNVNEVYAWHLRHTIRSTNNNDVYFRQTKIGYYPYKDGAYKDLPSDWLGIVDPNYLNPYIDYE